MTDPATTLFRASRIYREGGTLLRDGAVACREGRIGAVGAWEDLRNDQCELVDLGDVLLLPGLIDAHTHLRLTHLKGKIKATKHFSRWLARIAFGNRFTRAKTLQRSVAAGIDELLAGGVTTAVDIDLEGLSASTAGDSPLRLIFAHECIGLRPDNAVDASNKVFQTAGTFSTEPHHREHGIAPHAPYSVCRELWEALADHLRSQPRFLTIHVAESRQEVEMLAEGKGSLCQTLKRFRVLPADWKPPGCSPVPFLDSTGILETPGIAAHCSEAGDEDAECLARCGWTVAFCPGTHEFFGRSPWPLERFRRAGVPVCVATDSAASNTGLSMMEEMRRFARMFPDLSADEIIAAATSVPAKAIGWTGSVGRIEPGYLADFSAWSPACSGSQIDSAWFQSATPRCIATIVGGRVVKSDHH